jgi:hypothetical protein
MKLYFGGSDGLHIIQPLTLLRLYHKEAVIYVMPLVEKCFTNESNVFLGR